MVKPSTGSVQRLSGLMRSSVLTARACGAGVPQRAPSVLSDTYHSLRFGYDVPQIAPSVRWTSPPNENQFGGEQALGVYWAMSFVCI